MDLFELQAVLRLNASEYETGITDAEKKGTGFLDRLANKWTSTKAKFQTVKNFMSPVIDIVGDAVSAYGDYEQAVGGVRKLFGDSSKTITENARKAFKTAGVSINEYMDLCIQSGATMLKSVGEDSAEAARMMDMAIIDMADNVNALGTDMDSVMNAYRGFARGNFTMLDNLALGYAGTKEGMEELLADAEKLSGVHYDIGNYADIVQAIHQIQQYRSIAGTSANEAATTQLGSKAAMEAAKENMLITFADSEATQEEKNEAAKVYADAMSQYLQNLIPVIVEVLKSLLPALIDGLGELLSQIGEAFLPDWLQNLLTAIADVIKFIWGVVDSIFSWISGQFQDSTETTEDEAGSTTVVYTPAHALGTHDITTAKLTAPGGYTYKVDKEYDDDRMEDMYYVSVKAPGAAYPITDSVSEKEVRAMGYDPGTMKQLEGYWARADEGGVTGIKLPDGVERTAAANYIDFLQALYGRLMTNSEVQAALTKGVPDEFTAEGGVDVNNATIVVDGATVTVQTASGSFGWTPGEWGQEIPQPHAKGLWSVPYDEYLASLHRDEMVLTASQAREYRDGFGGGLDIVAAIQGLRNDIQHMQLVVGEKPFGGAVVDYSGRQMQGFIGKSEDRAVTGYGWR